MTDHSNALAGAQRVVLRMERSLASARDTRDAAVREALAAGMTAYRIAQITGLSQTAIHNIRRIDG